MQLSGAEILVEELINQGVTQVFGYPGGAVLNIYDELYKSSGRIHHVIAAHEQGAAHAADGYARATGKVGVVIATSGPGATNLVTGIANAYLDSVPMVAITGNVSCDLLGKDSFQEVDIVGITSPIVKHNYIVKNVADLEKTIKEAFVIAKQDRPGPVLIDIPKDVQINKCEYGNAEAVATAGYPQETQHNTLEKQIEKAVQAINESQCPYIYCGGGVVTANCSQYVQQLSEKINAPIGLSMIGITAIPHNYKLNLGMTGMHGSYSASKVKSCCDLLIAVGVRFSDRATGNKALYSKNKKIIHIDIDPSEINKNISAEVAICGDLKDILNKIATKVSDKFNKEWQQKIDQCIEREKALEQKNTEFSPQNIVSTVNSYCNESTVIATDVGQHQLWTIQSYKFCKPRTLLTSGGLGTMGYGLGAAIGGCIGNNKQHTVLFTGDGSFGMNLCEMATAVSQQLPIVIVIMNNGVLGMVRQWQRTFYGERFSETTLNRKTNFTALAEAFGAYGFAAENLQELRLALDTAFEKNSPVVIDCHIDMDKKVLPMIPPGGSIKDIILS